MQEPPRPEAFAEAARSGLTAANAATLSTCTVVGGVLSVCADVAPAGWGSTMAVVALCGWITSIALALYLAGRSEQPSARISTARAILLGARAARRRPGITALIVVMSAGATFTLWSRTQADQGGLLRSLALGQRMAAASAEQVEMHVAAIQADTRKIEAALTRPPTPSESLAAMGYGTGPADICRAVGAGDVGALRLMKTMVGARAEIAEAIGAGQYALCLEPSLLKPASEGKTVQGLKTIGIHAGSLNRLYVSQSIDPGSPGSLRPLEVLGAVGVAVDARTRLSSVRATPLMFATWGGDPAVVDALLAMGAHPNQASRFDFSVGTRMVSASISPLEEARRLHLDAVQVRLRKAGARDEVDQVGYFR